MTALVWDKVGKRVYEAGLDRGVLYLPDDSGVTWNGLTSVIEKFDRETSPVYYDGMKISELVTLGSFQATMKAVTYPDEFEEIEGVTALRNGIFAHDQPTKVFGLCYRTKIGDDLVGDVLGYKIHIIYNVTAIPSDKTYATMSSDPSLVEFEWDIVAIPENVPGVRPTAHFVIDSRKVDPGLLKDLEDVLYGSLYSNATLLSMTNLINLLTGWYRIRIIDNGDGSWTAIANRPELIQYSISDEELFTIVQANVVYLDDVTFKIRDTYDVGQVPTILIIDNGDGTWVAYTAEDNLFTINEDGWFQILNATAEFVSADQYELTDTP